MTDLYRHYLNEEIKKMDKNDTSNLEGMWSSHALVWLQLISQCLKWLPGRDGHVIDDCCDEQKDNSYLFMTMDR